jgi:hypothetical protein
MKPTQLMGECRESGQGGNWNPEAAEHWRWQLLNGEGPERLLAWVKLNTIGHQSPFAVDEHGRVLRIESAAADLGLAIQTCKNYCSQLQSEGRIRLKKARMYYRADVPETAPRPSEGDEESDEEYFVQSTFPAYLIDFYRKQSPEKRATMVAQMKAFRSWHHEVMAEGVAGLRAEISRVEITLHQSWGATKISLVKSEPADRKWTQLALIAAPDFVQSTSTKNLSSAAYTAENGSVQNGASLLPSDGDRDKPIKSVGQSTAAAQIEDDRPTDAGRLESEIKAALQKEWGKLLPLDSPTPTLIRKIAAALRGAPVAQLVERMRQRRSSATGYGFAAVLANDVGVAWMESAEERAKAAAARERHAQANREETALLCQETLNDPRASEEEKQLAREVLKASAAGGAS